NIVRFLNEYNIELFDKKIDEYLKSLEKIDREERMRQKKACQLLDRYRKNSRPDYKIAKSWKKECICKQIHLYQPISETVNGSINTVNRIMNGEKVGTINKQENPPLRRTPRKISRVIYTENSNKVNNTSKQTYKKISDEDSEVNNDNEIDNEINEDDNEDNCKDNDENDYEDDDENEDENIDEDDNENKGEDENKDKKAKKRKKLKKKLIDDFILRFKVINADDKWKLPSSRFVEDVLYDWAVTHHSETLAHSFILDTDCQKVMDLFSLEENETILNTNKKSFPAVQDDIKKYIMKYYKGRKVDILLKLCNSSIEILAEEVARTGDIHDKKYLGDRIKLLKLIKDMFDTIIKSLPPTTIENYESLEYNFLVKNKSTVYIMDHPEEIISRLTKKAQLEAPIYIEGIIQIIEKIESDELEVQVFQENNTGV
ncbi:7909_t:CDS:2, partial [Racocetra persica]